MVLSAVLTLPAQICSHKTSYYRTETMVLSIVISRHWGSPSLGVICYRTTDNWTFTLGLFENGYLATSEDKSWPKVLQNFHRNSVNTLVTLPTNIDSIYYHSVGNRFPSFPSSVRAKCGIPMNYQAAPGSALRGKVIWGLPMKERKYSARLVRGLSHATVVTIGSS